MKKRNVQLVLDMSMSMKYTIGLVYVFLYQLLSSVREESEAAYTFQITWFSGETYDQVVFKNGKNFTESFDELMGEMKNLKLRKGTRSNAGIIKEALRTSIAQGEGKPSEQIVMFFSDYYLREQIDMSEEGGINRALLFVQEGQGGFYRFRIVNQDGYIQKLMPVLMWNLETLKEELSVQDWVCMMKYLR